MTSQPARYRIGEVAERTGLTPRTLRYYEELGLLGPGRTDGGQRTYDEADLTTLTRIRLLRRLGTPIREIAETLQDPAADIQTVVERHLASLDARMQALGRHRERVVDLLAASRSGSVAEPELLAAFTGESAMDDGLRQRITLLVYDDLLGAHDFLVSAFGFGPGQITRDGAGRVVHAEIHVGDGVVWLHPASEEHGLASPASLPAATHCMAVLVDDVDEHYRRAVAAGVRIQHPPRPMDYGVREYDAYDSEGGLWSFMTPLDPTTDDPPGAPHV